MLKQVGWRSCLAVLFVVALAVKLHRYWQDRFLFDDAYMYCRYAFNFRHGAGIAWDPGGPHTFGLTSLPWFFIILAGSYVLHDPATLLTVASCVTGLLAIGLLSVFICKRAGSPQLRNLLPVFCCLSLLLLPNWRFGENWGNGMETMLGMFSTVLFLGVHQHFRERTTPTTLLLLTLSAFFCVLTRPELLIVVLTLPLSTSVLCAAHPRWRMMAWYTSLLCILTAVQLWVNKAYFGTAVPLAFYLKVMHGYDGYRLYINPWTYTAIFFSIALPFILLLVLLSKPGHLRSLAPYGFSLLLGILYLASVLQIMGGEARYYIPLLPLLIFPAMQALDGYLLRAKDLRLTPGRLATLAVCFVLSRDYTQQPLWFLGKALVKRHVYYARPVFFPAPSPSLPEGFYWKQSAAFASALPAGTVFAASEVGFLGTSAPQVDIIDLAGLNNAHLALHPMDVSYVLAQQPDLIWLPHSDYTRFYGALASSPRLLAEYDVYNGALTFGLAIRKSSRKRPDFEAAVQKGWNAIYPGYPMQNYLTREVRWDPNARLHANGTDVLE